MIRTPLAAILTVVAFAATTPSSLRAQASMVHAIDRVKQLYESAAYDEALAALDHLGPPDGTAPDRAVGGKPELEYRALCLLALDRTSEAEQVIERLLGQDPVYRPIPDDTSPRFVSVVDRARNRIIPVLARQQYDTAKRDFDEKRNSLAAVGFARVVALLDNPAVDPSALDSGDDLRRLAAGFLELSRAATAALPPAARAATPRAAIYSAADPDVVPPVALRQDLPSWKHGPLGLAVRFEGQIDVVINETGKVESATIVKSIFAGYNEDAIAGAKEWIYSPATRQGVPVKFRKSVPVHLSVN
jgi:hypothetical protein